MYRMSKIIWFQLKLGSLSNNASLAIKKYNRDLWCEISEYIIRLKLIDLLIINKYSLYTRRQILTYKVGPALNEV